MTSTSSGAVGTPRRVWRSAMPARSSGRPWLQPAEVSCGVIAAVASATAARNAPTGAAGAARRRSIAPAGVRASRGAIPSRSSRGSRATLPAPRRVVSQPSARSSA